MIKDKHPEVMNYYVKVIYVYVNCEVKKYVKVDYRS